MSKERKKIAVHVAERVSSVVRTGAYPAEPGVQPSGWECDLCYLACDAIGGGPACYLACDLTVC